MSMGSGQAPCFLYPNEMWAHLGLPCGVETSVGSRRNGQREKLTLGEKRVTHSVQCQRPALLSIRTIYFQTLPILAPKVTLPEFPQDWASFFFNALVFHPFSGCAFLHLHLDLTLNQTVLLFPTVLLPLSCSLTIFSACKGLQHAPKSSSLRYILFHTLYM
jgi:hypothetical protein